MEITRETKVLKYLTRMEFRTKSGKWISTCEAESSISKEKSIDSCYKKALSILYRMKDKKENPDFNYSGYSFERLIDEIEIDYINENISKIKKLLDIPERQIEKI